MKTLLSAALLSALLAAATPAFAQPAAPAPVAAQNAASGVVLDSANRILGTLDSRRAEFKSNPAALNQFIKSEFNRSFDSDYAARLVLGVHGRGAPAADVADFAGMNKAWDAWVVPGQAPARATVEARLANPAWKVEIVVTAAV